MFLIHKFKNIKLFVIFSYTKKVMRELYKNGEVKHDYIIIYISKLTAMIQNP